MQHDFILLDRTGSMASQWTEAINSVNNYVKGLAENKVDTGVTLVAFDKNVGKMSFDILRDRIIPSTWHPVKENEAPPRGNTPLNDAIARIVSLARSGNYDKVAIIIMTDGQENASEEVSIMQAKSMLDECRHKNWQVIFLGANYDNAQQAMSYGNKAAQTVQSSVRNFGATMDSLVGSRAAYASTGEAMGFTDEEKRKLAQ